MPAYGQFCSIARAHEAIGRRWTVLVVRELLCGSNRFNDIRRGIPRISRTMLSERLQELVDVGAVARLQGASGPEYALTPGGRELGAVIMALGTWGQRWLPRHAVQEDLDAEPLLADMQRRVRLDALPDAPLVVRFEIDDARPRFLLLKASDVAFCLENPGFPEPLLVRATLPALVAWWRGDASFLEARRMGIEVRGPRRLAAAFPNWFDRYLLADVEAAQKKSRP